MGQRYIYNLLDEHEKVVLSVDAALIADSKEPCDIIDQLCKLFRAKGLWSDYYYQVSRNCDDAIHYQLFDESNDDVYDVPVGDISATDPTAILDELVSRYQKKRHYTYSVTADKEKRQKTTE
jgi:hypothetical protein